MRTMRMAPVLAGAATMLVASGAAASVLPDSEFTGSYTLTDDDFGTRVAVSVSGSTRTIETNSLPNHETGDFPNSGNPNTITAQALTFEFPTDPSWTGDALHARVSGVAINGVSFEPDTAETAVCASGETYHVEALQDLVDLGLDFNDAHVQPTGKYHYHGVPDSLVDAFEQDHDLVHIGFAADGHLIYYSMSGAYEPSYELASGTRSGTGCVISGPGGGTAVDLGGTTPDGTYGSDWSYVAGLGDLDRCNGTTVEGEYVYLLTDSYPYVPRCLNGAFTEAGPGGPPNLGADAPGLAPRAGAGGPGRDGEARPVRGRPDDDRRPPRPRRP